MSGTSNSPTLVSNGVTYTLAAPLDIQGTPFYNSVPSVADALDLQSAVGSAAGLLQTLTTALAAAQQFNAIAPTTLFSLQNAVNAATTLTAQAASLTITTAALQGELAGDTEQFQGNQQLVPALTAQVAVLQSEISAAQVSLNVALTALTNAQNNPTTPPQALQVSAAQLITPGVNGYLSPATWQGSLPVYVIPSSSGVTSGVDYFAYADGKNWRWASTMAIVS